MKKIPIVEIILVILGSILYFAANIQRVAVPGAIFDVLQNEGLKAVTRGLFGLGTISTDFGAYNTVFAMLCISILFFADWFGQKYPEGMKSQGVVVR